MLNLIKNHITILILLSFFIFVNFNYLIHFNDRLHSFGDTLHHVRQIDYVSKKISQLQFVEALSLPHYYPRKLTLFYSDTLLFQAAVVAPLRLFVDNPFTIFNVSVLINNLLNLLFAYILVASLTRFNGIRLVGTLALIFNPFIIMQLVHFQLQVIWPILLSLTIFFDWVGFPLVRNKPQAVALIQVIALGIAFSILAYTSPYLLIISLPVFMLLFVFFFKNNLTMVRRSFFSALIFLIFTSPLLIFYLNAESEGTPYPEQSFVLHSAQIDDYIKPNPFYILTSNTVFNKWWHTPRAVSGERGYYPPLLISSIVLIFYLTLKKRNLLQPRVSHMIIVLSFSAIIGFILSLGPYFKIGDELMSFSLPGKIVMNAPLLSGMRAMARWELLTSLSVSLVFIILLNQLIQYSKSNLIEQTFFVQLTAFVAFVGIIVYLVPSPIKLRSPAELNWSYESYSYMPDQCNDNLLEIPFGSNSHRLSDSYHKLIFWSTNFHSCNLLNGSSSIMPLNYRYFRNEINEIGYLTDDLINYYHIDFVKINKQFLDKPYSENVNEYLTYFSNCSTIFTSESEVLFDCRDVSKNNELENCIDSDILVEPMFSSILLNEDNYYFSVNFKSNKSCALSSPTDTRILPFEVYVNGFNLSVPVVLPGIIHANIGNVVATQIDRGELLDIIGDSDHFSIASADDQLSSEVTRVDQDSTVLNDSIRSDYSIIENNSKVQGDKLFIDLLIQNSGELDWLISTELVNKPEDFGSVRLGLSYLSKNSSDGKNQNYSKLNTLSTSRLFIRCPIKKSVGAGEVTKIECAIPMSFLKSNKVDAVEFDLVSEYLYWFKGFDLRVGNDRIILINDQL